MVIRMRHTRAHRNNRRAHHALTGAGLVACSECGVMKMKHQVCLQCGTYKGRTVLDVHAKINKKEEKRKKLAKENQSSKEEK